ncbi:MAG: hypothetical protein VX366_03930 [Candidatus Thermoplasmatota archaeon]|nr:hypothetical protein [Candidatus Thermoplasmatota archaeon]
MDDESEFWDTILGLILIGAVPFGLYLYGTIDLVFATSCSVAIILLGAIGAWDEISQKRESDKKQRLLLHQRQYAENQVAQLQQQVEASNMAKVDMQKELELLKAQEDEINTPTNSDVNINDSAVGGDSLVGSTKIENQTVNDADAIAKAVAAAAVDAYRMGLNDRKR